ncbi:hypothetical protein Tco_0835882 [Tanacetum coccineum]
MQEELNEFERLEVWELVPRPDKVMFITLRWIYKAKLDELGGIMKNKARLVARDYESLKKYDMESSDPVDTPMGGESKLDEDPQRKAVDPTHYRGMTLIMWVAKILDEVHLEVCNYWETDLLAGHQKGKKALRYPVRKLNMLPCLAVVLKFHFIKEQVENRVVVLYFVNTEYQLADIFTTGRESIEFLINKLRMRSFTPETLKQLADEAEE